MKEFTVIGNCKADECPQVRGLAQDGCPAQPGALYHRMISILDTMGYNPTEVTFVTNKLKEWFPDQINTAATDAIVCEDEDFTGASLFAPDINLTQYYILKRSY